MKGVTITKGGYYFLLILLVIAAISKSIQSPISSLLLADIGPMTISALLSIGAVIIGIPMIFANRKKEKTIPERHLQKKDTPYLIGIIISNLVGNILFFFGLTMCLASSASLIKSFVIVTTAVIAFIFLKERISKRLWIAILLITLGCLTIAAGNLETLVASPGLLMILGSCICTSVTNVLMKKVADRNPGKIILVNNGTLIIIEIIIAIILGEQMPEITLIIVAILLGLVTFGLSSILFQIAARKIAISKCSTVVGMSPIIGAGISFIIFQEVPSLAFYISFLLLIPGFYLVFRDKEMKEEEKLNNGNPLPPPVEKYHDIRNYIVSAGFLMGFAIVLIHLIFNVDNILPIKTQIESGFNTIIAFSIPLTQIIIGCMILILRKRDMAGIVTLMLGFSILLLTISQDSQIMLAIVGILSLLLGFILLLGKERKKYPFALLFFLTAIASSSNLFAYHSIIQIILNLIVAIYLIILAVASSGIVPKFPLTSILAEDETTDFSIVGSSLCYLIAAISVIPWMITYLISPGIVNLKIIGEFSIVSGIMIGIIAILILFLGKHNKFIGAIFLFVMAFLILSGFTTGAINIVSGVLMFIAGLFCLLRKKSLILVGLMCILYGISSFMSIMIHGETVLVISQFCLQIVTFLVAAYLAFAVFSQNKKLPLF